MHNAYSTGKYWNRAQVATLRSEHIGWSVESKYLDPETHGT